jgi:hypothetical protein
MVASNSLYDNSHHNKKDWWIIIELKDKLDYQFPIIALIKKWLPYDMLVFNNEESDNILKCNPRGRKMY